MYQKKMAYYWIFALAWHQGNDYNYVNALKLTPVQQLTQRIDLSSESQSSYLAVNNALKKKQQFLQFVIDDEQYSMPYDDSTLFQNFKDLMSTSEFQKIQLTIKRWNLIEAKLRHAISLGNPGQIQAFEDIVHNIASSKVLLGHTLLLTGPEGDSEALNYLDSSCPVILNYAASWRSIDTDGWLDCFVSLRYLYAKNGMGGDLEHLESTLTEKLPWLLSVINNGNPNSDCLLCQLSSLSRKDRKVLSMELKNSWTLIESIRESFRILVEDFMNSNSARIRLGTFTKAQQVTDEILEHFAKSTAVTERDAAAYMADSSAIDIVVLRNKLHNEIKRETWTYLFVMNGVVDSGESFIKDLRLLLDSGSGDWNSVLSSSSSLTTDYGAYDFERKTIGFIDIDAILRIFEVALDAVQARDAALLSSHTAAVKEDVVDDSSSKHSSSQHSSTTKSKQQKQRRSSTTANKKTSTRSSRPSTTTKQSSRAPGPENPNIRKRSEWGTMWDSILSYTSFGSLIFIVIAAIGGHVCKNLKQPLKGNRSNYRYQCQLNSAKSVIHNILKTVGLLKYIVCWLRGHLFSYGNQSSSSSVPIIVSLSNIQGQSDAGYEHDNYLPVSIISIIIEDILIFVHEVRRGVVRFVNKFPSSTNVFKLSAKAASLEKVLHSKNLVIDCDPKFSTVSANAPPSPTAIATTSPGSSSSRQIEHFPQEEPQSNTSGNGSLHNNKAKPSGKKRNSKSGNTDTSASPVVASQNEITIDPLGDFGSADVKTEIDEKMPSSFRVQNKSAKGKAKKSSASVKKRVLQSISAISAPLPEESSHEKPEADQNDDIVAHAESAENKVLDLDTEEIIFEEEQEAKTLTLNDAAVSIIQPDLLFSVANEGWDDTEDGEWISASGSQVKNFKALNGGSESLKDKQSTKANKLCRQQLMRKREEEAYISSPRCKPAIKTKEKDKSPFNARAVSVNTAKIVEAVVKNSAIQQSDDRLIAPAATEGNKLGYSAVLVKNIPLSMRIAEPVAPVEHPSSSGSSGPVAASIHNSKRVGGQKFRIGGVSPSANHKNQGRASPRSKPNSITSTSTTATTVADEEHGTLSDSETSNATMNQVSDDSTGQYPVNVVPAGFPIMGPYPYAAPNLLSPEELMQYNINSMMMGFYPPQFGGQVHIPMAMPMAWPCVPELGVPFHPSQQYFAPLKPENQGDENPVNRIVDSSGMMFQSIPHGLLGVNPPFYGIGDRAPMPMYGLDLFPTDGSPAVDTLPSGPMIYVNRSRESSPTGVLPVHPLPPPLSHDDLLNAIRIQIEYYFSAVNLKHDSYLRGLMDSDGFVSLGPIVSFNRVKSFRASCQQILEAVHSSTLLEVRALTEAQDALDGKAAIASLPDSIVLATRIRGFDNPLA